MSWYDSISETLQKPLPDVTKDIPDPYDYFFPQEAESIAPYVNSDMVGSAAGNAMYSATQKVKSQTRGNPFVGQYD